MLQNVRRVSLVHGPTPLVRPNRLAERLGVDLWVKRDDMTAGPEAGNKVRKLEFLLADALAQRADTVITCGGLQSNHARATALCAASLGMQSVLFLRTMDASLDPSNAPLAGNVLLDRMVGADIRLISPETYRNRAAVMAESAADLTQRGRRPYVIPEGGSNGLGALGYVEAMAEVRAQMDAAGQGAFDVVIHACGSGGTAAGVALGARHFGVAPEVRPMAVCDDVPTFERIIAEIIDDARTRISTLPTPARIRVDARAKGPAYGVATTEQRRTIVLVARESGLILDPVYTGKAFSGLVELAQGELRGARVLFLHTGGLPGLLAQGDEFKDALPAMAPRASP